jgi:hypothetical protein
MNILHKLRQKNTNGEKWSRFYRIMGSLRVTRSAGAPIEIELKNFFPFFAKELPPAIPGDRKPLSSGPPG